MITIAEYEQVWMVKSSNMVLGPFSLMELVQAVKDRKISILDEVRSPYTRWGFIRDNQQLSEIINAIRSEDANSGYKTGKTTTSSGLEATRSITIDTDFILEDQTPTPQIREATPLPFDLNSLKSKSTSSAAKETIDMAMPKPHRARPNQTQFQSKGDVVIVSKSLILIIVLFVLAAGGGFLFWYTNRGPKPLNTEDLTILAKQYRSNGFYDKALNLYRKIMAQQKNSPEIKYQMLPLLLTEENSESEAMRYALDLLSLKQLTTEQLSDVSNWLGISFLKQNQFVDAEKEFKKLFELNPQDRRAIANLAEVLALQAKWDELIDFVKDERVSHVQSQILSAAKAILVLNGGQSINPHLVLSELQMWIKSSQEFKSELLFLKSAIEFKLEQIESATNSIAQLMMVDPNYNSHFVKDLNLDDSILSWKRLSVICDNLKNQITEKTLQSRVATICLVYQGQYERAAVEVDRALKEKPSDSSLTGYYAYILYKTNHLAEAKTLTLASTQRLSQLVRGEICLNEKDAICLENTFQALLKLDRLDLQAITGLAHAKLLKNNKEEAKQLIETGLSYQKNYKPLIQLREEIRVY